MLRLAFMCNNKCGDFKLEGISNKLSYENGFKWCSCCCMFLRLDGFRCPCCNIALRSSPKIKINR